MEDETKRIEGTARAAGCSCEVATSAEQGLAIFENHGADVILCDLHLPGMDGLALCERVRVRTEGPRPWFTLLLGSGGVDQQIQALLQGVDECVAKPVDPPLLRARLVSLARFLCRCGAGNGNAL
jgi:DNA-binding response OmpR family regulator